MWTPSRQESEERKQHRRRHHRTRHSRADMCRAHQVRAHATARRQRTDGQQDLGQTGLGCETDLTGRVGSDGGASEDINERFVSGIASALCREGCRAGGAGISEESEHRGFKNGHGGFVGSGGERGLDWSGDRDR